MPIAFEIKRSGFDRGIGCSPIYEAAEIAGERKGMLSPTAEVEAAPAVEEASTCTTSSSSSIGKNSESFGSDGEDLAGEKEVESAYKGPLSALEALEEALPIRRGISNFYNGKSKSFASLSDVIVSSASVKDLTKQENAYTRKRRNLLASKNICGKTSSTLLRRTGGGVSKKSPTNGRSMLALAMAMSKEDDEHKYQLLPPRHPSGKSSTSTSNSGSSPARSSPPQYCSFPIRSFSLTDLNDAGKRLY